MDVPSTPPGLPCTTSNKVRDNLLSSRASTLLGSLTLSLALAVGLPGNAFVVWTALCRLRRRTVTCVLILHLALADGVTLLTAPFWIHFLVARDWAFGLVACKLFHYVCCLNMYASVFLITGMSVDRLLAVVRPHAVAGDAGPRRRWAYRLLSAAWALAALAAVPAAYFRAVRVGRVDGRRICEPEHGGRAVAAAHYLAETGLGFLLPFGVLSACYGVVGRRVRTLRGPGARRAGKMVAALVGAFGALWLPYHAVNVAQAGAALAGREMLEGLLKEARPVVTSLAFVSAGVNPVLYAFCGARLLRTAGPNFMARLFEAAGSGEGGGGGVGGGSRTSAGDGARLNRVDGGVRGVGAGPCE